MHTSAFNSDLTYTKEPITVELGTSYGYQKCGAKRRLVERKDTYQYVPLLDNLQALLNNKEVYRQVSDTEGSTIQIFHTQFIGFREPYENWVMCAMVVYLKPIHCLVKTP